MLETLREVQRLSIALLTSCFLAAVALACAPSPVPRPSAVAPPSAASYRPVSPEPAATSFWTTPSDSDECTEYQGRAPVDFSTWSSRSECERWVAERRCRPGYRCYDGCNWGGCNRSGSGLTFTMRACDLLLMVGFESGTTELTNKDASWLYPILKRRMANPQRRLRLVGLVEANSAPGGAAPRVLARRRAEHLRALLIREGFVADRIQVDLPNAQEAEAFEGDRRLSGVLLDLLPHEPLREDFDPSSREYQQFCGAR